MLHTYIHTCIYSPLFILWNYNIDIRTNLQQNPSISDFPLCFTHTNLFVHYFFFSCSPGNRERKNIIGIIIWWWRKIYVRYVYMCVYSDYIISTIESSSILPIWWRQAFPSLFFNIHIHTCKCSHHSKKKNKYSIDLNSKDFHVMLKHSQFFSHILIFLLTRSFHWQKGNENTYIYDHYKIDWVFLTK